MKRRTGSTGQRSRCRVETAGSALAAIEAGAAGSGTTGGGMRGGVIRLATPRGEALQA